MLRPRTFFPLEKLFSRMPEKKQGRRSSQQVPQQTPVSTAPRRLWFSETGGLAMLILLPSMSLCSLWCIQRQFKNRQKSDLDYFRSGSANVSCKGPKSNYFRVYRPHNPCYNHAALLLWMESTHRHKRVVVAVSDKTTQTGQKPQFAYPNLVSAVANVWRYLLSQFSQPFENKLQTLMLIS